MATESTDLSNNKALSDRLNKLHSAFFEAKQNLQARTNTFQKLLSGQPAPAAAPSIDTDLGYEAGVHYRPPVSAGGTVRAAPSRAQPSSTVLAADIYGSAKQRAAASGIPPSAFDTGLGAVAASSSSSTPTAHSMGSPHTSSHVNSSNSTHAAHNIYGPKAHAQGNRSMDIVEILTASANQLAKSNEALGHHSQDLSRAAHEAKVANANLSPTRRDLVRNVQGGGAASELTSPTAEHKQLSGAAQALLTYGNPTGAAAAAVGAAKSSADLFTALTSHTASILFPNARPNPKYQHVQSRLMEGTEVPKPKAGEPVSAASVAREREREQRERDRQREAEREADQRRQADLDRQRDRERERENRERADTMRASLIGQRKSGLAGAPPERFAPGITAAVDARLAQQAAISAAESKSQYAIERGGLSNVVKKKKIDNTFYNFFIDDLPYDLQYHIFTYLSVPEMCLIAETCRNLNERSLESINTRFLVVFGAHPEGLIPRRILLRVIEKTENIDAKNAFELFLWSSTHGFSAFVERVIRGGDDLPQFASGVNATSKNDRVTALHLASQHNQLICVEMLLAAGAEPNKTTKSGRTPMSLAAERGNIPVLKALLESPDIDINKVDEHQRTPLHHAAEKGHVDTVLLLLQKQASWDVLSDTQSSLLHMSAAGGHTAVIKLLLERCDIDINLQNSTGKTALYAAVEEGHIEAVQALLKTGLCDVRKETFRGKIPLYAAAEQGYYDIVSLLLKHSKQADLFKLTSYGTTPMFIAAKSHPNIKNLFLEWVAKKQAKPMQRRLARASADDIDELPPRMSTPRFMEDALEMEEQQRKVVVQAENRSRNPPPPPAAPRRNNEDGANDGEQKPKKKKKKPSAEAPEPSTIATEDPSATVARLAKSAPRTRPASSVEASTAASAYVAPEGGVSLRLLAPTKGMKNRDAPPEPPKPKSYVARPAPPRAAAASSSSTQGLTVIDDAAEAEDNDSDVGGKHEAVEEAPRRVVMKGPPSFMQREEAKALAKAAEAQEKAKQEEAKARKAARRRRRALLNQLKRLREEKAAFAASGNAVASAAAEAELEIAEIAAAAAGAQGDVGGSDSDGASSPVVTRSVSKTDLHSPSKGAAKKTLSPTGKQPSAARAIAALAALGSDEDHDRDHDLGVAAASVGPKRVGALSPQRAPPKARVAAATSAAAHAAAASHAAQSTSFAVLTASEAARMDSTFGPPPTITSASRPGTVSSVLAAQSVYGVPLKQQKRKSTGSKGTTGPRPPSVYDPRRYDGSDEAIHAEIHGDDAPAADDESPAATEARANLRQRAIEYVKVLASKKLDEQAERDAAAQKARKAAREQAKGRADQALAAAEADERQQRAAVAPVNMEFGGTMSSSASEQQQQLKSMRMASAQALRSQLQTLSAAGAAASQTVRRPGQMSSPVQHDSTAQAVMAVNHSQASHSAFAGDDDAVDSLVRSSSRPSSSTSNRAGGASLPVASIQTSAAIGRGAPSPPVSPVRQAGSAIVYGDNVTVGPVAAPVAFTVGRDSERALAAAAPPLGGRRGSRGAAPSFSRTPTYDTTGSGTAIGASDGAGSTSMQDLLQRHRERSGSSLGTDPDQLLSNAASSLSAALSASLAGSRLPSSPMNGSTSSLKSSLTAALNKK